MTIEELSSIREMLCLALNNGSARLFREDQDMDVYFAWIGSDVFRIELTQGEAFIVQHQVISFIVIRGTQYWDILSASADKAMEDDSIMFSAIRAVATALRARMRASSPDEAAT